MAWAEDPGVMKRKAQNKLLAYRAARVDGMRKLAERIKGLTISSETYVKDFVAESDEINASLMAFLSGVREKGKPRYMEDGTCEVTVQVTLRKVIVTLRKLHERYYKGDKVKLTDFEKMLVTYEDKVLTEVGMGAPRSEKWEQEGSISSITEEQGLASIKHMSAAAKEFWLKYCTGQGRLMAVRAARVDGMRRLAERVKGVYVDSETTVTDFIAESDEINARTEAFISGAREVRMRYHEDELIVEVVMAVKLRTVYMSLKAWAERHYKGDKVKISNLEKMVVSAKDKIIEETGMGVPPERYLKNAPVEVVSVVRTAAKAPPWATRRIRAIGNAALDTTNENLAQAKLMAIRGAELDARRKLCEQINGLWITSNTSVVDFVTQNDEIGSSFMSFQQGGSVVKGSQKVLPDGTAEATVELDLQPLWNMVIHYQRTLKLTIK